MPKTVRVCKNDTLGNLAFPYPFSVPNLYGYEQNFIYFYKGIAADGYKKWRKTALQRKALMDRFCLNPEDGLYYDYVHARCSPILSAAIFNEIQCSQW